MHLPPPRTAEQGFAPSASSVSAARRLVTDCLAPWDQEPVAWAVQLLLSELATGDVPTGRHRADVRVAA